VKLGPLVTRFIVYNIQRARRANGTFSPAKKVFGLTVVFFLKSVVTLLKKPI